MTVSIIVATTENLVIGKDNKIPWYLPADLKYFKRTTLNHHILMGRKCYESIGRPLPKRTNVIITRNPFYIASNCITVHSLKEGIELARSNNEDELFIIGGGQIYEMALPFADRIYLTKVDLEVEGDVFFPEINYENWKLISKENHGKDDKNEYNYSFIILERLLNADS